MRNVFLLAFAQAFASCGVIVLIAFGGIVGARIAPSPTLATLPMAFIIVGVAAMTIPSALLMQRVGRKIVFLAATLLGSVAALLAAWAAAHLDFAVLCIASAL